MTAAVDRCQAEPARAVILPAGRGVAAAIGELWCQRRFVWFFCCRAVDFRYKRAMFGWFWLLVRSVLWMLPFSLVIGHVAGGAVEGVPYSLFILVGLTLWNYLANGVSFATLGLRYDRQVTAQLGLSPLLLVIANVAVVLIELAVSIVFLYAIAAAYSLHDGRWYLPFNSGLPMAAACIALATLAVLGIGLVTTVLDEHAPDVRLMVPYLLSLWMLLTPVIYPISAVPERYRPLAWLNPMTPIVEAFRWALLEVGECSLTSILSAAAAAAGIFVLGTWFFVRAHAPGP
jgi:lipopolysaccharide transport system permease protein